MTFAPSTLASTAGTADGRPRPLSPASHMKAMRAIAHAPIDHRGSTQFHRYYFLASGETPQPLVPQGGIPGGGSVGLTTDYRDASADVAALWRRRRRKAEARAQSQGLLRLADEATIGDEGHAPSEGSRRTGRGSHRSRSMTSSAAAAEEQSRKSRKKRKHDGKGWLDHQREVDKADAEKMMPENESLCGVHRAPKATVAVKTMFALRDPYNGHSNYEDAFEGASRRFKRIARENRGESVQHCLSTTDVTRMHDAFVKK